MGKSAPKTQTVINKTELPAWVERASEANYNFATDLAGQLPGAYQGNVVAGMESMQPAFDYAQGLVGAQSDNLAAAQSAAQNAAAYRPANVSAASTDFAPTRLNISPAEISSAQALFSSAAPTVDAPSVTAAGTSFDGKTPNVAATNVNGRFGAQSVSPQSFLTGNVNQYMNPYLENVETAALANVDRQRLQSLNQVSDRAISAGAFGGSRQGVMEGVTNAEAARAAGELSANIRNQGFQQASTLMQQDANRDLQGQLANQNVGMDLNRLDMQGQLANQQTGLQAQMANASNQMQMNQLMSRQGEFNAGLQQQASLANQQTGLQARLANAESETRNNALMAQLAQYNAGLQQQAGLANQQTGLQAQTANAQNQNALNALLSQQGQFNAGLQQQAALANQQAGLAGNEQSLQAALAAGNLASTAQSIGYRDVAGLSAIGEAQRQYQQDLLAQDAARFDANKAAQLEPLNLRLSALGMSPYGSTQTQTRTGFQTGSSPLMNILGAGSSLASIYSGLGGAAGIGSGISSIGSALAAIPAFFSDEKMKTNKQLLGRDAMTGLPIYAYDYKADVQAAKESGAPMPPKRVGPMAQDVAKAAPGAVGNVGGKKVVANLGFGGMR